VHTGSVTSHSVNCHFGSSGPPPCLCESQAQRWGEGEEFGSPSWATVSTLSCPSTPWPPVGPDLPADAFYARLIDWISVRESTRDSVAVWLHDAVSRILGSVRLHAFDVDALLCGSFATATHVRTAPWDIDVLVRFRAPPRAWQDEPGLALDDLARWLSQELATDVDVGTHTVRLPVSPRLHLEVTPCWLTVGQAPRFTMPMRLPQRSFAAPVDPAAHRDLISARNAALGRNEFLNLIRAARHLNQRWAEQHGNAPLTSFHIEALALTLCDKPFTLAEGMASFLRGASQLVLRPLRDPARVADPVAAQDPGLAASLLADAALRTEEALMTEDQHGSHTLLAEVFGVCGPVAVGIDAGGRATCR
jgi:hypothetical protein